MPLIIMHIIDKSTVLHDKSNKYQHTGEVVILYKDIKLSLWINTETQYDDIKFAQLRSSSRRFQQTENLFCKTAQTQLHFIL